MKPPPTSALPVRKKRHKHKLSKEQRQAIFDSCDSLTEYDRKVKLASRALAKQRQRADRLDFTRGKYGSLARHNSQPRDNDGAIAKWFCEQTSAEKSELKRKRLTDSMRGLTGINAIVDNDNDCVVVRWSQTIVLRMNERLQAENLPLIISYADDSEKHVPKASYTWLENQYLRKSSGIVSNETS